MDVIHTPDTDSSDSMSNPIAFMSVIDHTVPQFVEGKLKTELNSVKDFTEEEKKQMGEYYLKCVSFWGLKGEHTVIPPDSITVSNFTNINGLREIKDKLPNSNYKAYIVKAVELFDSDKYLFSKLFGNKYDKQKGNQMLNKLFMLFTILYVKKVSDKNKRKISFYSLGLLNMTTFYNNPKNIRYFFRDGKKIGREIAADEAKKIADEATHESEIADEATHESEIANAALGGKRKSKRVKTRRATQKSKSRRHRRTRGSRFP